MIDVAFTPLCAALMKLLHPEPFLPGQRDWAFAQKDSMFDANQALAWIVFVRDRNIFEQKFPKLKIEVIEGLPWITYLFSGGVTRKSVVPKFAEKLLIFLDERLKFLRPFCGLSWHIRLRKLP
jgi:hypothetical protein